MAGKRTPKKGPAKVGPEHESEIQRRMDSVSLDLPPLPEIDAALVRRHARLIARVTRWVEANPPHVVGTRLAMEIDARRMYERDSIQQCEIQARRKAIGQLQNQLNRLGAGIDHEPMKEEWLSWKKKHPRRYSSTKLFKDAMSKKYNVTAGRVGNLITVWKREMESQNGDT